MMRDKGLLSHFTTGRPVAVLMVFTAAVVFGYFSFNRLPVTLMPELNYPTLTVRTEYPGSAPEEVENDISRPIEEALGVVAGLNRISSISRAGISDVVLEFTWGTDMSDATQNTLEKLDLVFMPREAKRPLILHFDPSLDPVMELSLSGQGERFEGEAGLRRLRRLAELQIKRVLEPIKGVAAVRIRGGLEEEIHVLLKEADLLRTGISHREIVSRLAQENINVAGGQVTEGRAEYMVRTINEYESIDQIRETVIRRRDGKEVRLKDIGRVVRAHKEREIITHTGGAESVQIDVYKEADANMVSVAKTITLALEGKKQVLRQWGAQPVAAEAAKAKTKNGRRNEGIAARLLREEGADLKIVADRSIFIENSINEVRNTALVGGGLAILILFLFLRNLKPTLIIGISIPMSILITFAPLNLWGVSLNIMSLGGLALGIGMLVDSSIVVLESIFRCQEEGDEVVPAAIRGTSEVRGAVFASTLTSIAVFFPMVFVEGIAGQAFGDLGIAVVISLMASLFVAIFFIPMLASRQKIELRGFADNAAFFGSFGSWTVLREHFRTGPMWRRVILTPYAIPRFLVGVVLELIGKLILLIIALIVFLIGRVIVPAIGLVGKGLMYVPVRIMDGVLATLRWIYPRMIEWSLNHPLPVLLLAVATFYGTWELGKQLDTELLPEVHQSEFTFEVDLPVGTPLEETSNILGQVESAILENQDGIKAVLVTFGFDVGNMHRADEGEHSARFKILMEKGGDPKAAEHRVLTRLRGHFDSVPDLDVNVVRPILFSSHRPIVVEVHGDTLPELKRVSDQVRAVMAELPELADVEASLRSGAPEIQIAYNRDQIARFGLNISTVAGQIRDMVKGAEATRFNMKDRRVPVLVRLDELDRERVEDIGLLTVNPGQERDIPLNAIADLTVGEGPSEVRRIDGERVALVESNIGEASLGSAVAAITEALDRKIEWPAGMTYFITGQNEEWERSKGSLFLALGLSVFLVYVIMAAQFESLLQPLVIMFTIPLAFFGTIGALNILGISLSVVVVLGMIMLAGIVVNNAIVLVDYVNVLHRRGMELREAIVTAGSVRLRPILITTATTVLGLLPMAMGMGDGSEIRKPMAVAVISGLITSTLLTLVIIPTLFYLLESARLRFVKSPAELREAEPEIPNE
jgi:hydrophobic/amphiphilic exporter-1 (mainly G- bacteria), HAE1 family